MVQFKGTPEHVELLIKWHYRKMIVLYISVAAVLCTIIGSC